MIYRTEYPRPQMERAAETYINLNGKWQFEHDPGISGLDRGLLGRDLIDEIIVPFVPESELSGIGNRDFLWSVWYKRKFDLPDNFCFEKDRLILHFGAVNYITDTWLDGKYLGTHRGGYTPFEYDITDFVSDGENEIALWVKSDVRSAEQASGKQSMEYAEHGCMYPRCTGIWQTVWLEVVPKVYIKEIYITPDVKNEKADIDIVFFGYAGDGEITARLSFEDRELYTKSFKCEGNRASFSLDIENPVLWDVGKGNLYDLRLSFGEDTVKTYFGMRSVEIDGGNFYLNGRKLFTRFVLDQGYYPGGIYTAPTDGDIERNITDAQRFGFNGTRLHMKVFDPRIHYHADRHGHLLWGEYPNWGLNTAAIYATQSMLPEWLEEVKRDYNHPSIITWCPLNETGRDDDTRFYDIVYDMTHAVDKTRPVIDVSGFVHRHRTDIYDVHDYSQDPEEFKSLFCKERFEKGDVYVARNKEICDYSGQPYYVSEYGGTEWVGEDKRDGWGYGDAPKTIEEFYKRVGALTDILLENKYISGFCYTQLYDVYLEQNGIMRFDRSDKFDEERIRKIFSKPSAYEADE